MTDPATSASNGYRIGLNSPEMAKVYGPVDEVCIPNCTVHLEQLDTNRFWLGITRGDEEMHLHIFKSGKSVHAEITYQDGFDAMSTAIREVMKDE